MRPHAGGPASESQQGPFGIYIGPRQRQHFASPRSGVESSDGRIYFHEGDTTRTKQIVVSVKAGHVTVSHLRDLLGVMDRQKADIGVLLCAEEPAAPMRKERASAGFDPSPWGKHARLQILTIENLLTGKSIDRPPTPSVTFKRAPKAKGKVAERRRLEFGEPDDAEPR
jgi:hypothetical protein